VAVTSPRPALALTLPGLGLALALLALAPATAFASPRYGEDPPPNSEDIDWPFYERPTVKQDIGPFDRSFGISAYYSRWAGAYDAGGVGFRIRWEPLELLGVEVFSEILDVTVPSGTRINVPSGFNLYVPLELLHGFRVRALAGLCAMFSFDTGGGADAPSTQDIQFGVHVGLGAELAIVDQLSLFLDATYQGYWGHGHDVSQWTAAISDELSRRDAVQVGLGLQLHL